MPEHPPPRRWALVMDATRARIVDLSSPDGTIQPVEGRVFRSDQRHLRRIIADMSGQAVDRLRSHPGKIETGTDAIHADEREFLETVLRIVQQRREADEFDLLTLVALPPVLDKIQTVMPAGLRQRIERTVPADMTSVPASDIRRRLSQLMRS